MWMFTAAMPPPNPGSRTVLPDPLGFSELTFCPIGMRPVLRNPYGEYQRAKHQQNSKKRCAGCVVGFDDVDDWGENSDRTSLGQR